MGLDPHPFYFTPTLFIKAPLILKIPDPHPFSNLYVSYIHFWCHGNVVDWYPIALPIYHFTYFQPEDIPILSILFCKCKYTTWKSEEPHPLYQSTLFSGKMWTPTLLQFFKISNPHPLKCMDCPLCAVFLCTSYLQIIFSSQMSKSLGFRLHQPLIEGMSP